jgi:hypothetical protein
MYDIAANRQEVMQASINGFGRCASHLLQTRPKQLALANILCKVKQLYHNLAYKRIVPILMFDVKHNLECEILLVGRTNQSFRSAGILPALLSA